MAVQERVPSTLERVGDDTGKSTSDGAPCCDGPTCTEDSFDGVVGSWSLNRSQDVESKPSQNLVLRRADDEMEHAEPPMCGTLVVDDDSAEAMAQSPRSSASSSAPPHLATDEHLHSERMAGLTGCERKGTSHGEKVCGGAGKEGRGDGGDGAAEQHVVVNATTGFGRSLEQPTARHSPPLRSPSTSGDETAADRKLPAQFDPSTCRTLYVGNLHPFINESILQDIFSSLAPVTEVKIIKDKQSGLSSGFGFVKLADHGCAKRALESLHSAHLYGQEIRVNWAFQSNLRDDSSGQAHLFVGDLSNEITDQVLFSAFRGVSSECIEARVMWDHQTGRSKGYGFVSFNSQPAAEAAMKQMNGDTLCGRRIRVGWAQHRQATASSQDASEVDKSDPTNTNVYVGCLSPEVSDSELRRHFSAFGTILEVKQHRQGGYGFVLYENHDAAVRAICGMNGKVLGGKTLKCSWGRNVANAPSVAPPVLVPGPEQSPLVAAPTLAGMGAMSAAAPLVNTLPGVALGQQMLLGQQHGANLLLQQSALLQALLLAQQPVHGMPMNAGLQMLMQQGTPGMVHQNMMMGVPTQQQQQHLGSAMAMETGNMYYGNMYYGE